MALSIIDIEQVENEISERRELIKKITTHQVAPTALPGWWKSYGLTGFIGLAFASSIYWALWRMMSIVAEYPVLHTWDHEVAVAIMVVVGYLGPPFAMLACRAWRRENRFLTGMYATAAQQFEGRSHYILSDVRKFNESVRAMGDLRPKDRGRFKARLLDQHKDLLRRHDISLTLFDEAFGPCIKDLEDRNLHSRAERKLSLQRNRFKELAYQLGHEGSYAEVQALAPSAAEAPELPDPLVTTDDLFAELERKHGHETPRT